MLAIGLTGGIGSGKSTVAQLFENLSVPVLDADVVTRALVQPGQQALEEMTAEFGQSILNADSTLNRSALRERIFNTPEDRAKLEAILHPRVRQALSDWLASQNSIYAILVIPLIFESSQQDLVDRVLVVDCDEATQMSRVLERDGVSKQQIEAIMAAQWSRQQRLEAADDVVLNEGDSSQLKAEVERLHLGYLAE